MNRSHLQKTITLTKNVNDVPNLNYNQMSATKVIVTVQDFIRVQEDHICFLILFQSKWEWCIHIQIDED